ncbi:MAG: PQQ-binding-like beta-propeller repeat protein [Sphingomonas sp.]
MFKGDAQLSGVTDAPPPRGLLGVRFRFRADGPIRSTPVYVGGMVVFGSDDGHVYALDAKSGALKWRFAAGAGVASSPSAVDGTVYVTAWDGHLYAIAAATGIERWHVDLGRDLGAMNYWDFHTSSAIPFGNALYAGSGDGHLYAIDRASGRTLWRADAGARIRGTPAVTDKFVVFGTMSGHLIALDRATGARRWDFASDGAGYTFERKYNDTTSLVASPAISNGVVTIGGRDGNLYAVDLATGAQRWKITHDGGSWILSTAMQGGTVFSGSGSAYIIQSAKVADGTENWRYKTKGAVFGAIVVAGNVLVAEVMSGMIDAIDTGTGQELWHFPIGGLALGGPLIADNAVFAGSDDGTLTALDTTTTASTIATPKRLIHFAPKHDDAHPEWLTNSIGLVTDMVDAGYARIDDDALVAAMKDQVAGRGDQAIVFADPHLPKAATADGGALFRQFLEAGGTAIFLGFNPISFQYAAKTDELTKIDDVIGAAALGMTPLPRPLDFGYHVSSYTPDGRRWGLSGMYVTSGAVAADQVTTVLGMDRLGNATAWTKRYGARGLLVQLPVPRNRMPESLPLRAAIDHAVSRLP